MVGCVVEGTSEVVDRAVLVEATGVVVGSVKDSRLLLVRTS